MFQTLGLHTTFMISFNFHIKPMKSVKIHTLTSRGEKMRLRDKVFCTRTIYSQKIFEESSYKSDWFCLKLYWLYNSYKNVSSLLEYKKYILFCCYAVWHFFLNKSFLCETLKSEIIRGNQGHLSHVKDPRACRPQEVQAAPCTSVPSSPASLAGNGRNHSLRQASPLICQWREGDRAPSATWRKQRDKTNASLGSALLLHNLITTGL